MRRRHRNQREREKQREREQQRQSSAPPPAADHDQKHQRAKGWREENSPRHEAEYSGVLSAIFHFCLLMLLSLLSGLQRTETLPVAVDVIQVAEASSAANEFDTDFSDAEALQSQDAANEFPMEIEQQPETNLQTVTSEDVVVEIDDTAVSTAVSNQGAQIAEALAALDRKLNQASGGPSGGGSGDSGGGGGRAGRAARWILKFDTRSPRHYLEQLEGLGAEVAFPDQGDRWRYYNNLTSQPPSSSLRDLSRETRIYWMDQNPQTYQGIARELGVGSAPMMVAFLPVALENRMLEMELNYMGKKQEADILQTEFIVVRRGGGLDVQVQNQRLK